MSKKLGKRGERGREQKRASWAISSGVLLQLELKKDMNVQQIVGAQLFSGPKPILWAAFFRGFAPVGLEEGNPLRGKLARVGGHRRQPVLNPAMHKASDAGHIGPHGMRRCLSFSYRGTCHVPPTPPRRQKNGSFLKSARCA